MASIQLSDALRISLYRSDDFKLNIVVKLIGNLNNNELNEAHRLIMEGFKFNRVFAKGCKLRPVATHSVSVVWSIMEDIY